MRRVVLVLLAVACVAAVVGFQVTRPGKAAGDPRVFVPSPHFYENLSPSYRTSIADLYWLGIVQYYGEHIEGDRRLDSLPAMLDLVITLSPHFIEPYLFSTFALADAGQPQAAYDLLERGYRANPRDWRLPYQLGFLAYTYGADTEQKARTAAKWFTMASWLPGRPAFMPRLAANMLSKGGEREKAIVMWGPIYSEGDKFARTKAVVSLNGLLPKGKAARMKAVAPLSGTMPKADFEALIAELFQGYK
ncbi:MAG TPA: hypothetical protein VIK32_15775 [Candidatus Limnocylindrales bacterium]